jgi:hypothetical protein
MSLNSDLYLACACRIACMWHHALAHACGIVPWLMCVCLVACFMCVASRVRACSTWFVHVARTCCIAWFVCVSRCVSCMSRLACACCFTWVVGSCNIALLVCTTLFGLHVLHHVIRACWLVRVTLLDLCVSVHVCCDAWFMHVLSRGVCLLHLLAKRPAQCSFI